MRLIRATIASVFLFMLLGVETRGQADDMPEPHQEELFVEAVGLLRSDASGDKAKAVRELKKLAVGGHARSQRVLGVLYLNGLGVLASEKQALRWFEQAAEGRYPIAMLSFAELLMSEEVGGLDYARARAVLEELTAPGARFEVSPEDFGQFRKAKSRAHYLLGLIYLNGWGMAAADKERAVGLMEIAARSGERDASMYLAIAYAKGDGVAKSVAKAKEYFELLDLQSADALNREIEGYFLASGDAGDAENLKEASEELGGAITESVFQLQTQFALEVLESEGDEFDAEMAAGLLEMAAAGGFDVARVELGVLRYRGLGVGQDYALAADLFRAAAEERWLLAEYNLAVMIDEGLAAAESGETSRGLLRRAADGGLFAAQARLDGKGDLPGVLSDADARRLCEAKADEGDPRALFSLAHRKTIGWGVEVEKDASVIAGLYTRSAEAGYARAQYELGVMRFTGAGVPADPVSGFSWLRSAAFQEYPPALHFMGTCYAQGMGVEVDFEAAFRYFSKSAALGFDKAKNSLALFYLAGAVVPQDEWKASQLYLEAADEGDPQAAHNIGNCYLLGQGARRDVEEGLSWIARAAELGNLRAGYQLVQIYSEGLLVDRDEVEVAYWMERLAEFGQKEAMRETAFNYYRGKGRAKNRGKALNWITAYLAHPGPVDPARMQLEGEYEDLAALKRLAPKDYAAMVLSADLMAEPGWSGSNPKAAADTLGELAAKGFSGARLRLGKLHLEGAIPGASAKKGHDLLKSLFDQKKASRIEAERGYAGQAAFWLSRCYREGLGVKASPAKGIEWLELSAGLGFRDAQYEIGRRYVAGEGVARDPAKAAQWLLEAAKRGDARSRLQLARMHLAAPLSVVSQAAIVDWLKELVDEGSGEARALLRRYGVRYKEQEYEERAPGAEEEDGVEDPWAPMERV